MKKCVLLFGKPGSVAELTKAHVAGYTRSDGTFVAEHDDSRQAAAPKPAGGIGNAHRIREEAAKHLKKHVTAGGDATKPWTSEHGRKAEYLMQAAKHVEHGEVNHLTGHLNSGSHPIGEKRKVLAHVDSAHHEALGFTPEGNSIHAEKAKKANAEKRARKEAQAGASKPAAISDAGKKFLDQKSKEAFGHAAPSDKYFT